MPTLRAHLRVLQTAMAVAALVSAASIPASAGMQADLKSCTAGEDMESAEACWRVLKSGRLPKNQHYIAHFNRGWGFRNAGRFERAADSFTSAIEANPSYADSYYSRAVAWNDLGEREKAIADLSRYQRTMSDTAKSHFNRALLLRRLGLVAEALASAEKSLAQSKTRGKIDALKALILSDGGAQDQAMAAVEEGLVAAPGSHDLAYVRALILYRKGETGAAEGYVRAVTGDKPDYSAAWNLLGEIQEKRGEVAGARQSYRASASAKSKTMDERYEREEGQRRLNALSSSPLVAARD